MKLSASDLKELEERNISIQQIDDQINLFKEGFPFLEIKEPASTSRGIITIDTDQLNQFTNLWDEYIKDKSKQIYKFVPASGAATRMFKDLFNYLETSEYNEYIDRFVKNIDKFAFYNDLNNLCIKHYSKTIKELVDNGRIQDVIHLLLNKQGLNYSNLPKGLLKFHSYIDKQRTAFEEHLVEGANYINEEGVVNIHFTVSSEHEPLFIKLLSQVIEQYSRVNTHSGKLTLQYNISFSKQESRTDTIAVDYDNQPLRDEHNRLIFRPAGHGAILQNLNTIDADIIFIKNIDNVVLDKYKAIETKYKKILAGYLISIQKKIFNYLEILDLEVTDRNKLNEILLFVENSLFTNKEEVSNLSNQDLAIYLKEKLNRPLRVCGMVKNEGEAGGGPFFVINKDKSTSLQILESSQINKDNPQYVEMQIRSSHFNPVDIVCGIKNYKGEKFNLNNYVDKNTGFISEKSYRGKKLKALELPGLWNGAMSDWNTIFIEVPLDTFNPVKSVNDLLREHHQ